MEKHPGQGSKVWASGDAVPIVAATEDDLWVSSVIFQAKKVTADNTGNVFLGDSSLDAGVAEGLELEPGESWSPDIEDGVRVNLKDYYLDADTGGDGVVYLYIS